MTDIFTNAKRSEVMSRVRSAGECGDRVEVDGDLSLARDHGVAAEPARVWAAGFCVSYRASRGVCRWLLLARVPPALQRSRQPYGLLAAEARREPDARSAGDARAHTGGLEGRASLGACTQGGWRTSRRACDESAHACDVATPEYRGQALPKLGLGRTPRWPSSPHRPANMETVSAASVAAKTQAASFHRVVAFGADLASLHVSG